VSDEPAASGAEGRGPSPYSTWPVGPLVSRTFDLRIRSSSEDRTEGTQEDLSAQKPEDLD